MGDQIIPLMGLAFVALAVWLKSRERADAERPAPRPVSPARRAYHPAPPVTVRIALPPAPPPEPVPTPTLAEQATAGTQAAADPVRVPALPQRTGPCPKGEWQCLVGRKIEGVITTGHAHENWCMTQVFLVLEGGVHFEIFSSTGSLGGNSRLYPGGLFELLASNEMGPEVRVFGPVAAPENQGG